MSDELVHLAIAGGVATITLDSPANRNALSRRLFADLQRQVDAAITDPGARIIVLTATGTVFCSGADLKEQREANEAGATGVADLGPGPIVAILTALWNSPKPVLGRINGHARAGGIGLVAACDIAIATDTATFAFSEVRIGVAPAIISVVALRKMGLTVATELMLTGEAFTAERAAASGLINRAVPADQLDAATAESADALLQGGPEALAATKGLIREVPGLSMAEGFARMAALSAERFASAEAREGMTAFAEKRQPRWGVPEG